MTTNWMKAHRHELHKIRPSQPGPLVTMKMVDEILRKPSKEKKVSRSAFNEEQIKRAHKAFLKSKKEKSEYGYTGKFRKVA